jgi:GGDEF domain-containing protein
LDKYLFTDWRFTFPIHDAWSIYQDPNDRNRFLEILLNRGIAEFESELARRDGTVLVANLTAKRLLWGGERVLFTVFQNITNRSLAESALVETKRKMEKLASLDGLTGVANRRLFDERLEVEWRRACREKANLSLIIADIDSFKAFNDIWRGMTTGQA